MAEALNDAYSTAFIRKWKKVLRIRAVCVSSYLYHISLIAITTPQLIIDFK